MTTQQSLIIDTLRDEIRTTPKTVCPFAAHVAESTDIVVLPDMLDCANLVSRYPWKENSILIIAFDCKLQVTDVDNAAAFLQSCFPLLEVFGGHPEHHLPTRKDSFPNVQLNTRVALSKARKELAKV